MVKSKRPYSQNDKRLRKKCKKLCSSFKRKKGHIVTGTWRSGLEISQGNIIIVIDGDLQFSSNLVFKVYDELKYNNLDLCKTYRVEREDGIYRSVVSKIFNIIFDLLFKINVKGKNREFSDINSKPKAFTRDVYEKMNLNSNDWFIDCEIMIFAWGTTLKLAVFLLDFIKVIASLL